MRFRNLSRIAAHHFYLYRRDNSVFRQSNIVHGRGHIYIELYIKNKVNSWVKKLPRLHAWWLINHCGGSALNGSTDGEFWGVKISHPIANWSRSVGTFEMGSSSVGSSQNWILQHWIFDSFVKTHSCLKYIILTLCQLFNSITDWFIRIVCEFEEHSTLSSSLSKVRSRRFRSICASDAFRSNSFRESYFMPIEALKVSKSCWTGRRVSYWNIFYC